MNAFLLDKIHRPALALLIARVFTGGLMCYLHGWSNSWREQNDGKG